MEHAIRFEHVGFGLASFDPERDWMLVARQLTASKIFTAALMIIIHHGVVANIYDSIHRLWGVS